MGLTQLVDAILIVLDNTKVLIDPEAEDNNLGILILRLGGFDVLYPLLYY